MPRLFAEAVGEFARLVGIASEQTDTAIEITERQWAFFLTASNAHVVRTLDGIGPSVQRRIGTLPAW